MKYGKYWFHLQKNIFFYIANFTFSIFLFLKTSLERKIIFRLSRGVAGIAGVGSVPGGFGKNLRRS
jgi:hypothetical protein